MYASGGLDKKRPPGWSFRAVEGTTLFMGVIMAIIPKVRAKSKGGTELTQGQAEALYSLLRGRGTVSYSGDDLARVEKLRHDFELREPFRVFVLYNDIVIKE